MGTARANSPAVAGKNQGDDEAQAVGQRVLEGDQLALGLARQRGQRGHRQRRDHQPQRELVQRRGELHVGDALVAGARGQVIAEGHGQLVDQQPGDDGRIEAQDAPHRRVAEVKLPAYFGVAQGDPLHDDLQQGAEQHAVDEAVDLVGAQQGHDDDGAVEDGADEGGHAETAQGEQRAGEDAADAEEEHGGRGHAHQAHGRGRQRRIIKFVGPHQPADLRRENLHQPHQHDQQHRGHAQDCAQDAPQFVALLLARVIAEDGHQRRTDHAADYQVIETGRHIGGDFKGAEQAGRAVQVRLDRLAGQPQQAAGHIANRQNGRGTHKARFLIQGGLGVGSLKGMLPVRERFIRAGKFGWFDHWTNPSGG